MTDKWRIEEIILRLLTVIQYVHVFSWVTQTKDSATLLELGTSRRDTMKIRTLIILVLPQKTTH
jgi:hypothetical protein